MDCYNECELRWVVGKMLCIVPVKFKIDKMVLSWVLNKDKVHGSELA